MKNDVAWDLYRSFLAVVRQGSLSSAARRLGLTQPTLGRHIEALESSLAISLFTRSQGGLRPTPAALSLLPQVEAMEAAAQALLRSAEGARSDESGTVRITTSEIMGAEVLPNILRGLQCEHPGLTLEIVLNNRTDDLLRRDADIAVRMVKPSQDALIAQRLGELQLGLYAHASYIERYGLPESLAQMRDFHVIGFDRDDRSARSLTAGVIEVDRTLFKVRSDNDLAQLAAIRAGLGIGMMQVALAARDPTLRPVLAEQLSFKLEVWLAMHEDQRTSRPIRLAFDALARGLREWIQG